MSGRYDLDLLGNADAHGEWDAFARESPQGTPFSTMAWLEGAASTAGVTVDRWVVRKGSEWVAAAAMPFRSLVGRRVHVGLPHAAYSPVMFRSSPPGARPGATREHGAAVEAMARSLARRYMLVDLLLDPDLQDVRGWMWAGWHATPRYTYLWDLQAEDPWSDSVRRHVRKCREAGYRVTGDWDWSVFSSTFLDTQRRQGFPLRRGPEALRELAERMRGGGLAWMWSAVDPGGEPLASHIVLSVPGASRAFMWLAGTATRHLSTGAGSWIMTEVAGEARRRGFRWWDLCGADLPNVARFKDEFGARLHHYFQVRAPRSFFEWAVWAASRRLRKR